MNFSVWQYKFQATGSSHKISASKQNCGCCSVARHDLVHCVKLSTEQSALEKIWLLEDSDNTVHEVIALLEAEPDFTETNIYIMPPTNPDYSDEVSE